MSAAQQLAQVLASLDGQDVTGGAYPSVAVEPEDRRRWNESRLLALALYHRFEPSMLSGEYTQELYTLAGSIYRQSPSEFPTGTDEELAEEVAAALERSWL